MLDISPPEDEPKYPTIRRLANNMSKLMLNLTQRQAEVINEEDLKKSKWRNIVEVLILCVLITVVWGLLLIPIIFYYLPLPTVRIM